MNKILKISLIAAAALLVGLYLCFLLVLPNVINLNAYKSDLQKVVKDSCGLTVDFDGAKIVTTPMLDGVGLLCGTARELGEFKHYSQSCIPSIVLGKSFAHVITYLCHCITYFVIIPELYRFSFYYNFWLIFFILLPYLFGVSFLAQTLTILFKKRESSLLAIVVISLPLAFLPGIIWPKEAIPSLLRGLSMTLPCTGAMDSIVKVNQMGATFGDVKYSFILLVVLMIVYYFTAVKVYRHLAKTEN